jgi:hypothetical protein
MSKIVHVSWLNPSQTVDLYPGVLEGMKIEERLVKPTGEYFFLATLEEAQELKARMERLIPKKSYTILDENDEPVGHLVSEPQIAILNI